jgi:hypothetical protein
MLSTNMRGWKRFSGTFSFSYDEPIEKVTIELVADDSIVSTPEAPTDPLPIYVTDFHFQAGKQLTGWIPETQEFTKKILHSNKETTFQISTDDIYLGGKTPVDRTNLEFREYNIAGRGIEVFTLPNWYPEDWTMELLPTGLDLEITPKDDYDFCRVCTNAGSLKPEEEWYEGDPDHPLSLAYTREFSFGSGSAGVPLKILSRSGKAYYGSSRLKIGGEATVTLGDNSKLPIRRRSFFIAQKGAIRIRFEFYKLIQIGTDQYGNPIKILKDTGIGYQGTAKFNQWTYGRSRV